MKDLIAERDKKEKMQHSIIKWWNVHYMTPEELTAEQEKEENADVPRMANASDPAQEVAGGVAEPSETVDDSYSAQEILDRLSREAEEDEARKQHEIEQVRLAAEANFNEATGSYSGSYGVGGVKEKHREQIDAILGEKDEALRDLIERTGEE